MEPTQLDRIEAKLDQLLAKPKPALRSTSSVPTGEVTPAPDSDLDSEWGDPVVKKDPTRWKGPSMVGKKLSQTSPEFCDAFMGLALWKVGKDMESGDEKKAGYARRDAERALGWKLRLEAGYKASGPKQDEFGDDDIPFVTSAVSSAMPLDRWRGVF
jgi:hypothetical protein